MDFSCIRYIEFKEDICDDNKNLYFTIRIEGTYSYDEGDYWNPPSENFEIESVTFEEDVIINGKVYKSGSEVSDEFFELYAENPNYIDDFELSDIDDNEFIIYEPDYDSLRDEILLNEDD